MRRKMGIVVVMAALTACASAETAEQMDARMAQETAAFTTAIKGITSRWEGFYQAGQPDSVASLFTEEGRVFPPNAPAQVGPAAIASDQARQFNAFDFTMAINTDNAFANGPVGVSHGTYGILGKVKKGAPKGTPPTMGDKGDYLIHWHNVNGTWRVSELAFTSSWTAVPPKPAPVKKAPAKPAPKAPARRR